MHTVLRTISDESFLSSFHLLESLLLQAADGKVITKERCLHVKRAGTPCPDQRTSSGDESSDADCFSGSYTSGAINSDDDPGSLDLHVEHDRLPQTASFQAIIASECTSTSMMLSSPGSEYSIDDYAPLSTLLPKATGSRQLSKPPQKRQRVSGRPGKVLKEAYFKGIKWTKTFVTGTLDPAHNQFKFYCQISKTNVSIRS